MTMISLSPFAIVEASCRLGVGTLVEADGPPREGPTRGFLAMALFGFGFPPSIATLYQLAFFRASSETFMSAKTKKKVKDSIELKIKETLVDLLKELTRLSWHQTNSTLIIDPITKGSPC